LHVIGGHAPLAQHEQSTICDEAPIRVTLTVCCADLQAPNAARAMTRWTPLLTMEPIITTSAPFSPAFHGAASGEELYIAGDQRADATVMLRQEQRPPPDAVLLNNPFGDPDGGVNGV
jgi:hypothetical protein